MTMLALVVMWWGIFVFCFGIARWRKVSFGLVFLLFMVPLPSVLLDAIIGFLQRSSAEATDLLFQSSGSLSFDRGLCFLAFHDPCCRECSGIRSALSLFITSLVAGYFFLRSGWTKIGLAAIVIPLAIIKNAFRIVGLALLANYVDPTYITNSALHTGRGNSPLSRSLVVLFSLVWLLRRLEKRSGHAPLIEWLHVW